MGAPYTNSLPQYWHIGGSLAEFRRDLPRHIGKIGELNRIQLNEYADLKAILPVLWEEVLQHHPSSPVFRQPENAVPTKSKPPPAQKETAP